MIIHCSDRRGRLVGLLSDNWNTKMLLDHAEMIDNETSVVLTLESPDVHAHDRVHVDREVFYRWGALPPPDEDRYIKVVVAYSYDETGLAVGRVVTAFAVDVLTRGEAKIWTRPGFNPRSPG